LACLSAACGDDPAPATTGGPGDRPDAATPSGVASTDTGASSAAADSGSKPDAGASGLDANLPGTPEAGAQPGDAALVPVDATGAVPSDAADSAITAHDAQVPDAGVPDAHAPDAGSVDSGTPQPPDAGEPLCIERGDSCDRGSCCDNSVCVHDESGDSSHCVTPCEFPERCGDGCGDYCGAEPASFNLHCAEPILLAKDGSYLGRATSSTFANEGVCNPNSLYGNTFGTYSIHNTNGPYGNSFSQQSPYAPSNFDGPAIACPDEQVRIAYVNKAGSGFDDVDPDDLCTWLSMRGY
jgi:hypothetical protein